MSRTALQQASACLVLLALGACLVLLAPTSRLPYLVGCAFLFASIACLIDLITTPGDPPHMMPIAVMAAAGILVGGW